MTPLGKEIPGAILSGFSSGSAAEFCSRLNSSRFSRISASTRVCALFAIGAAASLSTDWPAACKIWLWRGDKGYQAPSWGHAPIARHLFCKVLPLWWQISKESLDELTAIHHLKGTMQMDSGLRMYWAQDPPWCHLTYYLQQQIFYEPLWVWTHSWDCQ